MTKIGLPKGSGKRSKVSEKSGNFEKDIEWQPCVSDSLFYKKLKYLFVLSYMLNVGSVVECLT